MSSLTSSRNSDEAPADGYGFKQGLGIQRWPSPSVVLASATFHWPLTYVSKLLDEKCVSDAFCLSNYTWRLKFSAKGTKSGQPIDDETCASFFVENMESSNNGSGPLASFSLGNSNSNTLVQGCLELGVINQDDVEKSLWRDCEHAFNSKMPDWGFERMILLKDLIDADRGFVVNDTLILAIRF